MKIFIIQHQVRVVLKQMISVIFNWRCSLASTTPTSISQSTGNTKEYILGINVTTANGSEILTVNPVSNSIYNAAGVAISTSQINNSINLTKEWLYEFLDLHSVQKQRVPQVLLLQL